MLWLPKPSVMPPDPAEEEMGLPALWGESHRPEIRCVGLGGWRLHSSGVRLTSSIEEQNVSVHVYALSVGVNSHSRRVQASALSHFMSISSFDALSHLPLCKSLLDTCRDTVGRNQFHCYRHYLKNLQALIKSLWRNLCRTYMIQLRIILHLYHLILWFKKEHYPL